MDTLKKNFAKSNAISFRHSKFSGGGSLSGTLKKTLAMVLIEWYIKRKKKL